MGGWPCSFYGKKNPMFWLWQIFLKMLEEVWNNLQQNLWFRENDTCMRFSRSSLACATRHKSPTFPVLSCSKRDYIDPSREKSPKPNGKGVQRHANGWKVVPSFLYVHGIKKKDLVKHCAWASRSVWFVSIRTAWPAFSLRSGQKWCIHSTEICQTWMCSKLLTLKTDWVKSCIWYLDMQF